MPPESFAPTAYPFSGEIRVVNWDYERLGTGWWAVTVASPEEWAAKIAEMQEGLRRHFGFYTTTKGALVPRWNDRTWERVRQDLVVEHR